MEDSEEKVGRCKRSFAFLCVRASGIDTAETACALASETASKETGLEERMRRRCSTRLPRSVAKSIAFQREIVHEVRRTGK